eukprot:7055894-Pyramimonas_sp.AAC.1
MPKWVGRPHVDMDTGAFGGAPRGATHRVKGVPTGAGRPRVGTASEDFDGAPHWVTECLRGVPKS